MGYENRRNPCVVIDDLALCESDRRVEDLIKVGQLELFAFDFDDLVLSGQLGKLVILKLGNLGPLAV